LDLPGESADSRRIGPLAGLGLLLASVALAGCAGLTAPASVPEHEVPLPATWSAEGQAATTYDLATYWQALGDPLLGELVDLALANNLDIEQAASRLVQARESLVQARAGYFPSLNAGAGANRPVGDVIDPETVFSLSADANWEIDLFGRIGNAVDAAEFDYASAGYSLADLRRIIAGTVATQVITARATEQQLAIARDTLANQEENLQIARWRNQAGLVSSLDVEQARTARAQVAATIPLLDSQLAATANGISTLIGEPPGRVLALLRETRPVPRPPELAGLDAPADLLRRRPDVRSAEAGLAAATARIGVARAQLYPALRLVGSIGTGDAGPLSLFDVVTGTVGAALSQLIFDGGRTQSQVRAAEALAEGSLAAWRQAILGALEDVESAIASRRAADERLVELAEALDAANNAAILARSQYQAGLTDFQTLLQAESQLLSARNSLLSAEADRATSFVRLTQALGGGWNGDVPQYDDDRTAS